MLKDKRARKREQKRLKAAAEEEEAAIAAELAIQAARVSNLDLGKNMGGSVEPTDECTQYRAIGAN